MDIEGGGGETLSEIYSNAKKLLRNTRAELERLEASSSSSSRTMEIDELSFGINRGISQIQCLVAEMDRLWRSIPAKPQRDLWRRKVEQVAEDAASMKESLDKYCSTNQKRIIEAKERAELFGRANGESSHVLRIFDEESQAYQSARNSSKIAEESYSTGVAILSSMAQQRERMKAAQRKGLDILNTVGLSNSVLRLIERRNRGDRLIKYAGVIITLVILFAFIRWTR